MTGLDPEAVEAFVQIAELKSFTRAAEVLNSTQAAVSLRVKRLEARIGRRLLDRTPRRVQLSRDGQAFIDAAREFVRAHHRAVEVLKGRPRRLALGITHHLVGPSLPESLKGLGAEDPRLVLDLRIGDTNSLLELLDNRNIDAAILLRHTDRGLKGERLFAERFCWFGAPGIVVRDDEPLPIAVQPDPCHVRDLAINALQASSVRWREVFVGGGAIAVGAAATAGLAVAVIARTAAPAGAIDVGRRLHLPALPSVDVMLHSNVTDVAAKKALRSIISAIGLTRQGR